MTTSQYRCLVAHMSYWKRPLSETMRDVGITDLTEEEVKDRLWSAGWILDDNNENIYYEG